MLVLFLDYANDEDENFLWISVALYNPTNKSICTKTHHYKRSEDKEKNDDAWTKLVVWLSTDVQKHAPDKLWLTSVLGTTALFRFERLFRQNDPSGLSIEDYLSNYKEIGYLDYIAWFSGLGKLALEEHNVEHVTQNFVKTLLKTNEIQIESTSKDGIYNRLYYHMSLYHSALKQTTTASESNSYMTCLPSTSSGSTLSNGKDCTIS